MLENILNQEQQDNVNNKMLELMDDNNGENTSHIEMTIEAQKKDAENVENQAKKEQEADDALAKETFEEV